MPGLLGWDAGWFESIAREGYGPLGHQSLRFFPLVPLMTHPVAWLPGVGDGAALILVANVAALVATALLFVLVRREAADSDLAPTIHLVPQPGPGSLRPGHGLAAFLGWVDHVVGDVWAPLRVQLESSHHGGVSDPFATLFDDARGLLHHQVGTALHVPWVLLAVVLLVVCWRRLPACYTVLVLAILGVALAGANLDSFERYALSAFPLVIAAAVLVRGPRLERAALVLLSAGLAGYALLAFLNLFVP